MQLWKKKSLPIPIVNREENLSERNVSKINRSFSIKNVYIKVLNLFVNMIKEQNQC